MNLYFTHLSTCSAQSQYCMCGHQLEVQCQLHHCSPACISNHYRPVDLADIHIGQRTQNHIHPAALGIHQANKCLKSLKHLFIGKTNQTYIHTVQLLHDTYLHSYIINSNIRGNTTAANSLKCHNVWSLSGQVCMAVVPPEQKQDGDCLLFSV